MSPAKLVKANSMMEGSTIVAILIGANLFSLVFRGYGGDELIHAAEGARDELIDLEEDSEGQLDRLARALVLGDGEDPPLGVLQQLHADGEVRVALHLGLAGLEPRAARSVATAFAMSVLRS